MPLPFEKDNERKYQCFICGVKHDEFATFKTHIIEKHEEGREYILCPLLHCGSPVRDLRGHYRAKHKDSTIPAGVPFKAMLWKDQLANGKLKQRKPKFRDGIFISMKNNGKEFHYKSGKECELFECLEGISEIIAFDYEPFNNGIPYFFEGSQHHYHPDLSVKFNDGRVEIWEYKPAAQTGLPVNDAKWQAATAYCSARGWDFIVITEVGLNKLKKRAKLEKINENSGD